MLLPIFTAWVFGNKDVKNGILNKFGLTAIFTAITGFIAWLTDLVVSGMDKVTGFINDIAAMEFPDLDLAQIWEVGAIANAVLPLTETLTIFGSLYVFWGVVLIIRWIKSFIPTVAN